MLFRSPQVWRTNIAVDHRLPGNIVATAEYIYNKDVNGVAYYNANLPANQATYAGADNRPRWTGASCTSTPFISPCVSRLNNVTGNQVTNAIVLTNQGIGKSWNAAFTLSRSSRNYSVKAAYSYGESKNTVDAGSIASGSWTGNQISYDQIGRAHV